MREEADARKAAARRAAEAARKADEEAIKKNADKRNPSKKRSSPTQGILAAKRARNDYFARNVENVNSMSDNDIEQMIKDIRESIRTSNDDEEKLNLNNLLKSFLKRVEIYYDLRKQERQGEEAKKASDEQKRMEQEEEMQDFVKIVNDFNNNNKSRLSKRYYRYDK